jgi:hypothetical protein
MVDLYKGYLQYRQDILAKYPIPKLDAMPFICPCEDGDDCIPNEDGYTCKEWRIEQESYMRDKI